MQGFQKDVLDKEEGEPIIESGQILAADEPRSKAMASASNRRSIVEMYVQSELRAVMRIKLQFFKWFEQFFTKTMNVLMGNRAGVCIPRGNFLVMSAQ